MDTVNASQTEVPLSALDTTIEVEKTRSSCEASKKSIISQALNDAAKDTSSADSIVDDTVEVKNDRPAEPKPDVFDRFFGFAESMVCSADNTTNVEIDPKVLAKEDERTGLCACGAQEAAETAEAELLVDSICKDVLEQLEVTKEGNTSSKDEAKDDGKAETTGGAKDDTKSDSEGLEKKASDDTGSTDVDTVDGTKDLKKSRRKFWMPYTCCMGQEIEDSVVYNTATPQACA